MAPPSARRFFLGFAATCVAIFAVIAGFNVVVDPFWVFDLLTIPGINEQRPEASPEQRMAKAQVVCRRPPTAIAMGSSRVEVGIDPNHPAWQEPPGATYNLGLAGAGLDEMFLTFQHAVHASPKLRQALIGLDFFMFNAHREAVVFGTEVVGFDPKRLLLADGDTCLGKFLRDSPVLLGLPGLKFSWETIQEQLPDSNRETPNHAAYWESLDDEQGYRGNNFSVVVKLIEKTIGGRNVFDGGGGDTEGQEYYYVNKIWLPPPSRRYCFSADGQANTIAEFRQFADFARKSGVDVRFMINPIHARMLVAIEQAGLWPQYEDWKRALVSVLDAEAQADGAAPFPLWDFSGFNSITTEVVPARGDMQSELRWWWEPSHYKSAAGDLMLDRVLDYKPGLGAVPEDFGVSLDRSMIEAWVSQTRDRMRTYERESGEAQIVLRKVDASVSGVGGTNCGSDVKLLADGAAAVWQGDAVRAEAAFKQAAAVHEADRQRAEALGVHYRESGFETTLALAQTGDEFVGKSVDWQAYQKRGNQRIARHDVAGAIDDYTQAIRTMPTNPALYFLRGVARLQLPDYESAAQDFKAGLALDPTNPTLAKLLEQAKEGSAKKSDASQPTVDAH